MKNRPNLLVPIAGKGQRFIDSGHNMPKPLIMVDNKQIIDWSFLSIDPKEYQITFVVRQDHIDNFGIDSILIQKFGDSINIIATPTITRGTVESCLLAEKYIDNDNPLVIYTLDVHFQPKFYVKDIDKSIDGMILTFKDNSTSYSYVQLDENQRVIKTAEKNVISENAAVGIYYFSKGSTFVRHGKNMIENNLHLTNNEFYVCPIYNLMIEEGSYIVNKSVDKMYLMGTPEELYFFKKYINKVFGKKPIALCSDHSGLTLKNKTKSILTKMGYEFIDFGTHTSINCDYYDYIKQAGQFIEEGICDYGLFFCRTGQGVNIAANKLSSVRSALVYNENTAEMAVRHNAANVFSFSENHTDIEQMENYIKIIAYNTFDGGRHQVRLQKIKN